MSTRPIGYIEIQKSWVGAFDPDEALTVFGDLMGQTPKGYVIHGSRVEHTKDGAGVDHHTYYLGLVPKIETTPPLNPRNLNEAPKKVVGSLPDEVSDGTPLGWREQQFGRGT